MGDGTADYELDDARRQFQVRDQQEYQSAMLIFQEISNHVKKMSSDMATLRKELDELKVEKGSLSKLKSGNKLPDGLSVS